MSGDDSPRKIGDGHAGAMWRQGLAELRAAVYPDSNVAQPVEYGMYGKPTPGEVAKDRTADSHEPSVTGDNRSVLAKQEDRATPARDEPGQDQKHRDMET